MRQSTSFGLGSESVLHALLSPEEGNAFIEALRGEVQQALALLSEAIAGEFSGQPRGGPRLHAAAIGWSDVASEPVLNFVCEA